MTIDSFRIRASYPNFYMVRLYAQNGREIFNHDSEDPGNRLEGNKPGTIVYTLAEKPGQHFEFPPRWYDMYCLLKLHSVDQPGFIELLLTERFGPDGYDHGQPQPGGVIDQLEAIRDNFWQQCRDFVESHPLVENEELITTLTDGDFSVDNISNKGRMLIDLTRNCYPVPDFCILTAAASNHEERLPKLLEAAISNLEVMTGCRLGDGRKPLVFAIRCAMPQYIPGLMPTILNVGVTRQAYEGLLRSHRESMANRVYLSTLHTLSEMLGIEHRYQTSDISLTTGMQLQRMAALSSAIENASPDGLRLLTDAHFQALQLLHYVRGFYAQNQDLILTFMQGRQAQPSFILQRMVWTIGNNESYPGVLYSRHSRTGCGKQIESYRNIFGEEIMTGDVTSEDLSYTNRNEIMTTFPAVYHFDPLLKKLETRYKSPVTIEFAVESRPRKLSLFSVLQLNMSEMTGRAALISAVDMADQGIIPENLVPTLIKPYHLRQIISASIDDTTLSNLQYFGRGLSVLPRTAISATLCFSATTARQLKAEGRRVCLCQERFIPEDTVVLNEVDAILSLSPAAIHVVTACRGYGIPAFMDLRSYGMTIDNSNPDKPRLLNHDGLAICEMEYVTLSSKRQTIYRGVAEFKPARFTKYLEGQPVDLTADEKLFFEDMKRAYERYQIIVTSQQATDINDLARRTRLTLKDRPQTARRVVNNWYTIHSDLYVDQILQSRMGDHNDQSRLFNLLSTANKIAFFQRANTVCRERGLTGVSAGSFMVGRFVSQPLPVSLWNAVSDAVVAFMLNEYVLYEKYLYVLQEVGEMRLARAHSRIQTESFAQMQISNFNLRTFIPLLHSVHDWNQVSAALGELSNSDNTQMLINILSQPLDQIFDLSKPYKRAEIEQVLQQYRY
ncbi:MAG: hypothetical protein IJ789_01580 [Bacteroidales bacterium]|nr:hypothetical protein [Bacteroidales bacterium]